MRKDDHLIYESLVQSRAPISDEQAAKMITDKIKGTPNLNIQNIKMYVQKYLSLVGKAPSDVDFIASMVHDNLQNMGMGENAEDSAEDKMRDRENERDEKQRDAEVKVGDFFEAYDEKYVCVGVENVEGRTVVHGLMLADAGDSFPIEDVVKID